MTEGIYADSSFLVSLYTLDANSEAAITIARSLSKPLIYTALHRIEVRNAFALAEFRGVQTREQSDRSLGQLTADLRSRVLQPAPMRWSATFRRAAQIAWSHTPKIGSRSLDILHVASAEKLGTKEFITFDHRQRKLAESLGMQVRP